MNSNVRKSIAALSIMFVLSGIAFADAYDSMAKKLSKGAGKLTSKKIAVLPFPQQDGVYSAGSNVISERLVTRLASIKGMQVIERSLLDKVMNEMKLESTGIIDAENTKKLGKVLGVDAIVTGTLIDIKDNETEVNARLINIETGEILSAAVEKVEKTWKDKQASPAQENEEAFTELAKEENESIKKSADLQPFQMVDMAQDLAREKRYTEAIAFAKQGFRRAQNKAVKAKALFTIGRIFEETGSTQKAKSAYRLIIKNFPHQIELVERAKKRLGMLRH